MTLHLVRTLARMAFRNVRKNARHSVGTLLAIAVGFVALSLFEGYIRDLSERQSASISQRNMFGDVLIEAHGATSAEGRQEPWRFRLEAEDRAFIDAFLVEHREQLSARARFLGITGLASATGAGALFSGLGYDVEEGAQLRGEWAWNAVAGRPISPGNPGQVMFGTGLGAALDCVHGSDEPFTGRDGLPIPKERPLVCRKKRVQLVATTERGQLNTVEPEVVGLFNAVVRDLDGRMLLVPLPLAQKLLDTDAVSMYSLALARPRDAPRFIATMRAAAEQRGLDIDIMPWTEHASAELYRRGMELIGIYRTFMVLVVIAIAGMSVLMTMMKSVNERTREVGSLRSLGFLRRDIVALFALEGAFLTAIAVVVGQIVTLVITFLVNAMGVSYRAGVASEPLRLGVAYVPSSYLFAFAFLSSVALLAAILPARKAACMRIPDALGHV